MIAVLMLVACANRPAPVSEPSPPPVDESNEEPKIDPRREQTVDGIRSWYEGDTLIVEVPNTHWCKSVYDASIEVNTTECFGTPALCGPGCFEQKDVACLVARRVLDGSSMFRCFATMQMCGEQWIMLLNNVEYRNVSKCGVSRMKR